MGQSRSSAASGRRVRAPRGQRPIALNHHRFEWPYVTVLVPPATGGSFRHLRNGVDKVLFEDTLALLAREAGAGCHRIIILVPDGAGWHTAPGLRVPQGIRCVPQGIRLLHLPPCTPEPQPAETPWVHVDAPIANRHFQTLADLDAAVAQQCVAPNHDRERIRRHAGFRWCPERVIPT